MSVLSDSYVPVDPKPSIAQYALKSALKRHGIRKGAKRKLGIADHTVRIGNRQLDFVGRIRFQVDDAAGKASPRGQYCTTPRIP